MKRNIFVITTSLLLSVILISGASAFAGAKEVKARMKARRSVINALKAKGIIGENNKGYLQLIGKDKTKADVVNAENSDRKKVYATIAKQQGTTVDLVGKRRAIQISKKAKPSQWLQDEKGKWYQKK